MNPFMCLENSDLVSSLPDEPGKDWFPKGQWRQFPRRRSVFQTLESELVDRYLCSIQQPAFLGYSSR